MAQSFHIDADNGLVTIRLAGELAPVELRAFGTAMAGDARYHPRLPQLIDCRGLELERADRRALAAETLRFYRARQVPDQRSIAIVVDPGLKRVHMAGVYRLACALRVAELFDDYELALRWLMRREFAERGTPPAERGTEATAKARCSP